MDFLTIVHIIIAIILILLVLVQDSKGAMGSTFGGGGGAQTLFGSTGMDNILTKSTKVTVVFFALTCILLTRLSSENRDSVLDVEGQRPTQPVPTQQTPSSEDTDSTEASEEESSEEESSPNTEATTGQAVDTTQGLNAIEAEPNPPIEDSTPSAN